MWSADLPWRRWDESVRVIFDGGNIFDQVHFVRSMKSSLMDYLPTDEKDRAHSNHRVTNAFELAMICLLQGF